MCVVFDEDSNKQRLREILNTSGSLATFGHLVSINGPIQNLHVHISEIRDGRHSNAGTGPLAPCEEERSRRLMGIRARLRCVPGGQRKVSAYLRREFGKAEPEDLFGPDLERLYSWVHSLPNSGV